MNYLEIIRDILISIFAIVGFFGLLVLYIKVFRSSRSIKKLNKEIDNEIKKLNDYEIKCLEREPMADHLFKRDDKIYRQKKQYYIEKLKREKENILEQISIYKIFKK